MAVTASPKKRRGRDARIEDLPVTLSKEERHAAIKSLCKLNDEVWELVYVLDKEEGVVGEKLVPGGGGWEEV